MVLLIVLLVLVLVGDPQWYESQKALAEYHARRGIGY